MKNKNLIIISILLVIAIITIATAVISSSKTPKNDEFLKKFKSKKIVQIDFDRDAKIYKDEVAVVKGEKVAIEISALPNISNNESKTTSSLYIINYNLYANDKEYNGISLFDSGKSINEKDKKLLMTEYDLTENIPENYKINISNFSKDFIEFTISKKD